MHLTKSKEARTVRDWESVEEESHLAISSGADSSPQVTKSYIHTNFVASRSIDVQDFAYASVHKYTI